MDSKSFSKIKQIVRWLSYHTPDFPMKVRWLHLFFGTEMHSDRVYNMPLLASEQQFMQVAPNTEIGREIMVFGLYEKTYASTFYDFLRLGDNVIDVGANIGQYTLLAAEKVGPEGKVLSIEACPHIFDRLKEHVARNRHCNVLLLPCAVGAGNGKIHMKIIADSNDGMHHISFENNQTSTVEVDLRRIDDLLDEHLPGKDVDVVKIDVEGWEESVFSGATQLFTQKVPPTIFFEAVEAHATRFGFSARKIAESFLEKNYQLFQIDERSRFRRWLFVDKVLPRNLPYNLLAIHSYRSDHLAIIRKHLSHNVI